MGNRKPAAPAAPVRNRNRGAQMPAPLKSSSLPAAAASDAPAAAPTNEKEFADRLKSLEEREGKVQAFADSLAKKELALEEKAEKLDLKAKSNDKKSSAVKVEEIRVIAKSDGFYKNVRRRPGDAFSVPLAKFSSIWMKKVI